MVHRMCLLAGAWVALASFGRDAQAQCYGTPAVVSTTYRVSGYRPAYAVPVYRAPVTVYRAPVYRAPVAPVYRSGVSIGVGIGGPSYYGRGFGYPGYGFGPYGSRVGVGGFAF